MRLSIEHQATRVCESSEYLFGREAFAKSLSNIFSNSESGFVLAIDATWGAGKTAFIHQLIHDLKATEKLFRFTMMHFPTIFLMIRFYLLVRLYSMKSKAILSQQVKA